MKFGRLLLNSPWRESTFTFEGTGLMKETKHQHTFSIRKSAYGAASVMVASCIFVIGGGVAEANDSTTQTTTPLEVAQTSQQETHTHQTPITSLHTATPEHVDDSKEATPLPEKAESPKTEVTVQPSSHTQEVPALHKKTQQQPAYKDKTVPESTIASKSVESNKATENEMSPVEHHASNVEKREDRLETNETTPPSVDREFSHKIINNAHVNPKTDGQTNVNVDTKTIDTVSPKDDRIDTAQPKQVDAPKENTTAQNKFTSQASDKKPTVKAAPEAVQNPENPKNKDPFVFVHGFTGFVGEVAAKGENYWGGTKANLQNHLRKAGYETYEASVSALASNHERAVELYYYLKGGRVDYGAAHSEKYGHERYGKTYEGVLKDWKPGHPVHFIGHSMGGQTIRLLEHYLRFGDKAEIAYQQQHGGIISELFKGGQDNMVTSITTIATPHNGTHASDDIGNTPTIRNILYSFAQMSSHLGTIDFGMDHWGFKRKDGESLTDYNKRIAESKIWDSEDTGLYDLTREGAEKINQKTELNPNIYYKTYTGVATHETQLGKHIADLGMEFTKILTGNYIGSVDDILWRPNDGLVSEISSQHPSDEKNISVDENSELHKGTWQVMPTMKGWDHSDFIGNDTLDTKHSAIELTNFYDSISDYLMRIEKAESTKNT
ncbi:YSIRK-type signal peptide-containing protein [Staphylococcus hyicus]|uniref:YSIRK-targeted triacylglycerol lipase n=1 Tax=Staphylococcus hyicus TaxID=1284 RepID=UPI001F24B3A3|nr:YSIRK-type signal peptide-containing protein [Staphylococcus hyicus]MCE5153735.1 YSIRK-type signal peptide-containing protein [Staphylococcus hyicus]